MNRPMFGYSTVGPHASEAQRIPHFRPHIEYLERKSRMPCRTPLIFDYITEAHGRRHKLEQLLSTVKSGDTVYVYRITDLGFTLSSVTNVISQFIELGCIFHFVEDRSYQFYTKPTHGIEKLKTLGDFERMLSADIEEFRAATHPVRKAKIGRPARVDQATITVLAAEKVLPSAKALMSRLGIGQTSAYEVIKGIKAQKKQSPNQLQV